MCVVSMVYDYGRNSMPPNYDWTRTALDKFKHLVRTAEDLDRETGQADCEDPKKSAWLKDIEDRLARLEKATLVTK